MKENKKKNSFAVSVGKQIKEARLVKKYTINDMINDKKLGIVSRSTYFYYESGEVEMPMSRFMYVCDKLGLNYSEVMKIAREESKRK